VTAQSVTSRFRRLLVFGVIGASVLAAWVGAALPARVRIPQLTARTAPPAAQFSHLEHAQMQCYVCHPGTFPQAPLGFTHAEMRQRRYCGACHAGNEARAIAQMACQECHAEE
jgi:c(7)-type cytochrome triheme protein